MGPLSGKEKREYLALKQKEERENLKFQADEARKQELHQIKVASAAAKANGQESANIKVKQPVLAPLANRATPTNPEAGPTDKVPALLTPGEAVIPAAAAQDPANKGIIQSLVDQGRQANKQLQGIWSGITNRAMGGNPPMSPSLGTGMAEAAKGALSGRQAQLDAQEAQAVGYADGVPRVPSPLELEAQAAQDEVQRRVDTPGTPENAAFVPLPPDFGQKEFDRERMKKFMSRDTYELSGAVPRPSDMDTANANAALSNRSVLANIRQMTSKGPGRVNEVDTKVEPPKTDKELERDKRDKEILRLSALEPADVGQTPVAQTYADPSDFSDKLLSYTDTDETKSKFRQLELEDQLKFGQVEKTPEVEAERKSWLTQQLENIYGPSGMFNAQDLTRFALLTAGGMLTGGSTAGSVRYAGLDTLKQSDARRQAEAAARQSLMKEFKDEIRTLDTSAMKALDKKARPIQDTAITIMQQAKAASDKGDYAKSKELLRKANMLLNAAPDVKDGTNTEDSLKNHKVGSIGGQDAVMAYSKDGTKAYAKFGDSDQWREVNPTKLQTREEKAKQREDVQKAVEDKLNYTFAKRFGGGKDGKISDQARAASKNVAVDSLLLLDLVGPNTTPNDFAKMVELTVQQMSEYENDNVPPADAFRKAFLTNAIMSTSPTDKHLYMGKSGKIDLEQHTEFTNKLEGLIADKRKSDPGYDASDAAKDLKAKWEKLPKSEQERWNAQISSSGRKNATGFLLWANRDGLVNKKQ